MKILVVISLLVLLQGIQSAPAWSPSCPHECWCHESYLASIVDEWQKLNQMQPDSSASLNSSAPANDLLFRAAICVQQHDTKIETLLARLPSQTEAMKIIQASDAPEIRLTATHLSKFVNLRALGLEGSEEQDPTSSAPSIILHSDSLKPLTRLQYLSLVNLELLDEPSPEPVTVVEISIADEKSAPSSQRLTYDVPEEILPYEEFKKLHQQMETSVPWKGFSMLIHLEYLLIVGCQLPEAFSTGHSGAFTSLSHLKELTIRTSQLRVRLEMEPGDLMELESLSLADNELLEIKPGDLQGMGALEHLDLSGNQLTHLTENSLPFLPDLESLDLSANPLATLYPNTFANVSSIRRLWLGSYRWREGEIVVNREPVEGMEVVSMEFGPDSFNGLLKLQELWISQGHPEGNSLDSNYFKDLLSITELHLRGRMLSIDADTFTANRRLQHLDLKNCQLRRLSVDAFQSLRKLRLLDLSSNQLATLPPGLFDPVVSLKELWLNGNRLTTVPADIFAALTTTKLIRLEDNPWHCTCQLDQLRATAVNKIKILDSLTNRTGYQYDRRVAPLCASPEALKGASVFDVIRKPLRCNKVEKHPGASNNKATATTLMAIYGNDNVWMNDRPQLEDDEMVDHGPEATEEEESHPLSLDSSQFTAVAVDPQGKQEDHAEKDIIDHGEEVVENHTSSTTTTTTTALPLEATTSVVVGKQSRNNNDVLPESINNFPEDRVVSLKKSYLPVVVTLSKKSMKLRMEQEMMKSLAKKKLSANL